MEQDNTRTREGESHWQKDRVIILGVHEIKQRKHIMQEREYDKIYLCDICFWRNREHSLWS